MRKCLFLLCSWFLTSGAFAQSEGTLCRRWYTSDIFTGYLYLSATPPQTGQKNPILWMDTHIPYGIRPLGYEIKDIECSSDSARILADSNGAMSDVEFKFQKTSQSESQPGHLFYLDKQGHEVTQVDLECSVTAIEKFCRQYSLKLLR